jgi:uncharacterized protein
MPFITIVFHIVIILLVPLLSIANLQMIDKIREYALPDKRKLYIQSAINQLVLTAVALWAAHASEIEINYIGNISTLAIIGGVVFLTIAFVVGYISNNKQDLEKTNPGLDLLRPNTFSEKITWIGVNLVAASCEEIIFRGVLYNLFLRTTELPIVAAVISAIVFGVAHSIQGIVGIIITAIFGLGLQQIAHLNNGLLIAMIVHFLYNIVTTFVILPKNKTTN